MSHFQKTYKGLGFRCMRPSHLNKSCRTTGKKKKTSGDMVILALEGTSVGIFIVLLIRMGRLWLLEHRLKRRVLAFFDDFDHTLEFVQCCVFLAIVSMRFAIVTVRAATHPATHTVTRTVTHIAAHCNTLQHAATRCNTLQHAATRCNTLQYSSACSDVCSWWSR